MNKVLLSFMLILFSINNIRTKTHFKGNVFKDPYKIKRLVRFQNNLCKELNGLQKNHESLLTR